MEIEKGFLEPVVAGSEVFDKNILPPLQKSYIYEESQQSFRYTSAFLVKNTTLQKRYEAFRTKRINMGYSEEELEESFGFLLFEDKTMAITLAEVGVVTGYSTCSTLGDPSKGVYVSKYSDCLDLNRWYQGKSGYIAIIRLTKGRINKVPENYTQNFTSPTVGYDCHASEQLDNVSANTSSFLAFERSQYYMYELLDGGNATARSPSHACPFAIVSFSYGDSKATTVEPQEKSEEGKAVFNYYPWKGQLQIRSKVYHVGLKSSTGALIPAKLPTVMEASRAIAMVDLKLFLPKAVFETCFTGEVSLDGMCCSLYQLVPSEAEDSSLSLLTLELKVKDLALPVQLNDGGFLILLHSSQFLTYEDAGSNTPEVLQGMFVFPDSRAIQRDTKICQTKPCLSPEVLLVLPALSYAETEVDKCLLDQKEELCEVMEQHIQSYAALIHPGLEVSPSREASFFPDQYDVPDALKYLYSSPVWTDKACQHLQSYLNRPDPFQLSVSKATELLAAGREERGDEQDDDVYYCLSSPEGGPRTPVSSGTEGQSGGEFPAYAYTQMCRDASDTGLENIRKDMHSVVSEQSTLSQLAVLAKDLHEPATAVCLTADRLTEVTEASASLTSDDISAGLVVSVTSAQRTVPVFPEEDKCDMQNAASANSRAGQLELQVCSFPNNKLQVEHNNSSNGEFAKKKTLSELPETTPQLKVDWRKLPRRRRKGQGNQDGKLTKRVLRSSAQTVQYKEPETEENVVLSHPLKRKTERWDLKAITTKCGRIFVPHGSEDVSKDTQSLGDRRRRKPHEKCIGETMVEALVQVNSSSSAMEIRRKRSITETTDGEQNSPNSDCSVVHSEKKALNDGTDLLNRNSDAKDNSSKVNLTQVNCTTSLVIEPPAFLSKDPKKREFVALSFSKLKKVLSRGGKGKPPRPVVQNQDSTSLTTEPLPKKSKIDKGTETLENVNMSELDKVTLDVGTAEVTQTQPLDPDLARALGLAPKALRDDTQKTPKSDSPLKKGSLRKVDQTTPKGKSDKMPQPSPSSFPTSPTMGRMRPLQKRGVSTETIRKKWWLHFHTPASFASERLEKNKSPELPPVSRSYSVSKGHCLQEVVNSADPPTDALTLLADLALCGSNDKVLPLPDPLLERKLGPSLETYSASSPKPQSLLHDMLRPSAAKPCLPADSLLPKGVKGRQEGVVLISTEHSYSLPPSSSLLGLSGAFLQVPALSSTEGLQQHRKDIYGDGTQALFAFLRQDNTRDELNKSQQNLNKSLLRRRKLRRSRSFTEKDGSIQVTRRWKENYDFSLDSKFTNDLKDKTVIRALHGAWDFNIKDTNEQIQLIIHMWIGLFYSKSTSRFFHIDQSHAYCVERSCAETVHGTVSDDVSSKIKTSSSELGVCCRTSDSELLDLSKGAPKEPLKVLDLSTKNTEVVDGNDSREGLPMAFKNSKDGNNLPSCSEIVDGQDKECHSDDAERSKIPLKKDVIVEDTDLKSSEHGGLCSMSCDTKGTMCIHLQDMPETNRVEKILEGDDICNSRESERNCDGEQNLSQVTMVQAESHNSSKTIACTEVEESCDDAQTEVYKSRDGGHEDMQKQDLKENDWADDDPSLMDVDTPTKKEMGPDYEVNLSSKPQPGLHVGKDSIDKALIVHEENVSNGQAYQPAPDGIVSKDEFEIEMQNRIVSKAEARPLVCNGSDHRENFLPELYEKNTSSEKTAEVGDGIDRIPTVPPVVYKELAFESPFAVQYGTDSKDKSLHVHCKGSSLVQAGNGAIGDVLPMEHSDDVLVAKVPSEILDGAKFRGVLPINETATAFGRNNLLVCGSKPVTGGHLNSLCGETVGQVNEFAFNYGNSNCRDQGMFDTNAAQSQQGLQHSEDAVHGQIEIPLIGVENSMKGITDNDVVDSRKDIAHSKVSHPQNETCRAVQDKIILQYEVDSIADVTNKEVNVDSSMDIPEPVVGLESNMDASKPETSEDSYMDISHSEVLHLQDDPSNPVQGHIKTPMNGKYIELLETKVSHSSNEMDEIGRHRVEIPLIGDCFSSEYTPQTEGFETNLVADEVFYNNHQMVAKERPDKRCQTPTVDEMPYDASPWLGSLSVLTPSTLHAFIKHPNSGIRRSSTPTQDELPSDHTASEDSQTVNIVQLTNSNSNSICNLHGLALEKEDLNELTSGIPHLVEKELHKPTDSLNKPNDLENHLSSEQTPIKSFSINPTPNLAKPLNLQPHLNKTIDKKGFTKCHSDKTNTCVIPLEKEHSLSTEGTSKSYYPQTHKSNEPRPSSQRPVMAVKPSKSEESRAEHFVIEQIDYTLTPDVFSAEPAYPNTTVISTSTQLATDMRIQSDISTGVSEEMDETEGVQDETEFTQEAEWLSKEQHIVRKLNFSQAKSVDRKSSSQYQEWDKQEYDEVLRSSRASSSSTKLVKTDMNTSQTQKDWYQYCHAEERRTLVKSWLDENDDNYNMRKSSLVAALDHCENGVTNDKPIVSPSINMHTRTIINTNIKGSNCSLVELAEKWTPPDLTQSSMDKECLIFSEKMNQILKGKRRSDCHDKATSYSSSLRHHESNKECSSGGSPVTVCFSSLKDVDSPEEHWEALPSLMRQKIKVAMPERCGMADTTDGETSLHLQKLYCANGDEAAHSKVLDMAVECARLYSAMMDDVCAGKKLPSKPEKHVEDINPSNTRPCNNTDFCGQMKRDLYDSLHDKLNSVVRQSCKIKFRFFMLVTSTDTFFRETKELLESEGHCEVGPPQFFLNEDVPSSPLIIIIRNEDIADHICEVPHLLELKKSPGVLFAGIDRPDDIVNLTHQELFSKGGFVVFEGTALEVLSLCNMKKMAHFLEEMSKKGKWKWMLHYRDSRLLREHARSSAEAQEKKLYMDFCQETGMVEVLPYHECDVISKERPSYLQCLVRLQVQNISARFPVFITDTTADNAFAKHGILTMNINSFLLISQTDSCTIS
ncbi:protein TASOR 2 isoform X1 [Osmerus mordax]|uniref:protein TASOR 2 isoform X1 n=1 Tax=Osmerus mordax TaxID=8014 RepID=UPI00350ED450